eukprot:m.225104 g.225104  ORF g.225104 m.225104 type:complete len:76 (-) comp34783_c0_seq1:200-427(-)
MHTFANPKQLMFLSRTVDYMDAVWKQPGMESDLFSRMPGFGKGITGEVFCCKNPLEFMKIVRNEGSFPSGVVEFQ